MMSNNILELVGLLNNEFLWIYFALVIIAFYALISLLTWNIKKPLMYLGIPTIIVGIILLILRFSISLIFPNKNMLTLLNLAVKPLFTISVVCIIVGIAMIIIYKILNKMNKKEKVK